jgi:uncharacterized protein (TIGR03086 family)
MEGVALLQRTVDVTTDLVEHITPDQLSASTPCTEWTVRDLINHITGGATMFAVSAEQGSVPDELMGQLLGGDNLGDDYKGAWKAAAQRALKVYGEPGVMEKIVKLPFAELPAGVALNIAVFDVATHACDLARATGQTVSDDELLSAALAMGPHVVSPEFRAGGFFAAEKKAEEGAPLSDQLLAFAGRDV